MEGNCSSKILSVGTTAEVLSITGALAVLQALLLSLEFCMHTPPDVKRAGRWLSYETASDRKRNWAIRSEKVEKRV